MEKIELIDEELRINTKQQSFDIHEVENRRFMYNAKTGTFLLGKYYSGMLVSTHAEEHGRIGAGEPFDDFIRGWIGYGGQYENGVIHFTPPISKTNIEMLINAYFTLEMFAENGANSHTIVRGFRGEWEQPMSNIIKKPTLMERLEQNRQKVNAPLMTDKKRNTKHERG